MNPKNSSRRQFVKSTLVATAPFILPSRIWSAPVAPSDRIGLGFIGIGKKNRAHLNAFLGRSEVVVRAVCEVDKTRREDALKRVNKAYGNKDCMAYNDFREMLARDDIDAVVIATPDHWHAPMSIAAAKAGKDIYCEKPLTHNVNEAVALVKAVRVNNRILQTGSQQRSSMEFRVAAELVRNKVIGKLERVDVSFGDPIKPGFMFPEEKMEPGLDWDLWCGPSVMVPYNSELSPRGIHNNFPDWRHVDKIGGGPVTDWGAHMIDIAHWGLNEDGRGPVEIKKPEPGINRGAKLVYQKGVEMTHVNGRGVSFFGEDGEVHVHRGRFEFILGGKTIHKFWDKEVDTGTSLEREVVLTEREFLKDTKVQLYKSTNHHEDWIKAIRSRKNPVADVAIGASSVIACHLMNMVYWYGEDLKWDPVKNKFLKGGKGSWLTREYRDNWKNSVKV